MLVTPTTCAYYHRSGVGRSWQPAAWRNSVLAMLLSMIATLVGPFAQDGKQAHPPRHSAERIDGILTRLEARNDTLRGIRCKIEFVEKDDVNISERKKWGSVSYLAADPNPLFKIHFESGEADGIKQQQEWYLFDGRFLFDAVERRRHVTKQEIVRPGEKRDFFDLERAPFPMPFGQKKASILRHFDITLTDAEASDPPDTDHLICVPKATSRLYRKYDRLDMFVHREVHLPTRIVVVKNGGYETQTANFPDLSTESINTGLSIADFKRPSAWSGYEEVVEMLSPAVQPSP